MEEEREQDIDLVLSELRTELSQTHAELPLLLAAGRSIDDYDAMVMSTSLSIETLEAAKVLMKLNMSRKKAMAMKGDARGWVGEAGAD